MSRAQKSPPKAATAKAKLIRNGLRCASEEGVSAQAIALLATLIAESWPEGRRWVARLGLDLLAKRLGASRDSVRRWANELESANLLRREEGHGRAVTRWHIGRSRGSTHATFEVARMQSGGGTHATSEVAPVPPVTGTTQDLDQEADVRSSGQEGPISRPEEATPAHASTRSTTSTSSTTPMPAASSSTAPATSSSTAHAVRRAKHEPLTADEQRQRRDELVAALRDAQERRTTTEPIDAQRPPAPGPLAAGSPDPPVPAADSQRSGSDRLAFAART